MISTVAPQTQLPAIDFINNVEPTYSPGFESGNVYGDGGGGNGLNDILYPAADAVANGLRNRLSGLSKHQAQDLFVQTYQKPFEQVMAKAASLGSTNPDAARQVMQEGYAKFQSGVNLFQSSGSPNAVEVARSAQTFAPLQQTIHTLSGQLGLTINPNGQMSMASQQGIGGLNDINIPSLGGVVGDIVKNLPNININTGGGQSGTPPYVPPAGQSGQTSNPSQTNPVSPTNSLFDSLLPAILLGTSVGANIYSGNANANAAKDAAQIQADSTKYAADLSNQTANKALDLNKSIYDQNLANSKPWLDTGTAAINDLGSRLGITGDPTGTNYGSLAQPFGEKFSFTADDLLKDPGYQTRLDAAHQAMERAASSKGMLFTPGTQARIDQKIGEGAANEFGVAHDRSLNEFMNRYNIFNNDQNTMFNRLSGVAGTGQVANSQVQNAGSQYGNTAVNTATGATRDINELNTTGQDAIAKGLVNSTRYGTTGVTNSIDDITSYINELLRQRKATV